MVSGFIASVQGHIIANKFLVLAKVRHSQRINDSLISCWVITERQGTILFAHCLGCKAGLAESCSHIASVLFYLEAWTKINGRLACTQVKCSWILPTYVKQVEYEKVREINFTSARKMKNDLDAKIENLPNVSSPVDSAEGNISKDIPVPSKPEMDAFYAKLSKSISKPITLSLIPEYADSYVLKSRCVSTISDLFDKKYLDLCYPELLKACHEVDIKITKEQITQVERDSVTQAKGNSFFRHRAGRIGASQSKAACQTNPAMPSQSLIQSICYPELNKLNTKAIIHGCQHEEEAIRAYEEIMKKQHINFKIEKCGLMINEEYPWLHATRDFLCSCDCCGEGCGEVKCPLCIENCDFDNYVAKPSSCLEKTGSGNFSLKTNHQYYFQVQQQLFTYKRLYCDFIVCAFGHEREAKLVTQRHFPDEAHWVAVLPKLTSFWRTCVLPEVLGRWYTRKHDMGDVKPTEAHSVCFCRTVTSEDTVRCCNAKCPIMKFHLSCLCIASIPKTWYCPNCRTLPEFKRTNKSTRAGKKQVAPSDALILDSICVCKKKPSETDKLLECHNEGCNNGRFFHLACINLKRMPNTSKTTWVCPACKTVKQKSSSTADEVKFVKEVKRKTPIEKYKQYAKLGQAEYDLIMSPTGWLDGTIIHEAQTILRQVNSSIRGFQRPTLGPIRQFDIMTGDFIQILNINNNHWVCVSSIGCPPGHVNLMDSLTKPVISKELQELVRALLVPNFQGIFNIPVQQQMNASDCGVFAIAYATCLVYGQNPCTVIFDIPRMRQHLHR